MKSEELYEEARKHMPGGVSSPVRAFKPFPFFTTHAKGSRIYDVDGREFIDFCLAYGPLVLGHRNDEVLNAVKEQLERGWLFGTPHNAEIELAKAVKRCFPSIEMLLSLIHI